jgi:uncharacterized protein (DUF1778 family)
MSFPLNVSFKDDEFERVNKAAAAENTSIREFVKTAALEKAESAKGKC